MEKQHFEPRSSRNILLPLTKKWFWAHIWEFVRYWPCVGTLSYDCATPRFVKWRNNVYYPKHQKVPGLLLNNLESLTYNSTQRAQNTRRTPSLFLRGLLDIIPALGQKIASWWGNLIVNDIRYIDMYYSSELPKESKIRIKGRDIVHFGITSNEKSMDNFNARKKMALEEMYFMTCGAIVINLSDVRKVHDIVHIVAKRNIYSLFVKPRFGRGKTFLVPSDTVDIYTFGANVRQSTFYAREQYIRGGLRDMRTGTHTFFDKPAGTIDIYWEPTDHDVSRIQIEANKALIKDCKKQNNWLIGLDSKTYNRKYYEPAKKKAETKKGKIK